MRYDAHSPLCKEADKAVRILKRLFSESFRCVEHTVGRILDFKEAVDEGSEENIRN